MTQAAATSGRTCGTCRHFILLAGKSIVGVCHSDDAKFVTRVVMGHLYKADGERPRGGKLPSTADGICDGHEP